jgi:hypothetical protein
LGMETEIKRKIRLRQRRPSAGRMIPSPRIDKRDIVTYSYLMACKNHPEREAIVKCQKMDIGYCQECLDNCEACTDPCGYCKFRSSCIIWELCKRSPKRYQLEREAQGLPPEGEEG